MDAILNQLAYVKTLAHQCGGICFSRGGDGVTIAFPDRDLASSMIKVIPTDHIEVLQVGASLEITLTM